MNTRNLNAPDWLIARPIAHRGLHDKSQGRIENSIAAAKAAIAKNYAIECDVQITKDGDALVFHDYTLERLTPSQGRIDAATTEDLQKVSYKEGIGTLPTLDTLLATIAGQTPLIIEVKSRFDGDLRLAERVALIVTTYAGPVAIKSFDPDVLRVFRNAATPCPIGFLGEASYEHEEWVDLSVATKAGLSNFSFYSEIEPDFLSWSARDLPHAIPRLCRDGIGMPIMAWTLRSSDEQARIAPFVDQIVFEGFAA